MANKVTLFDGGKYLPLAGDANGDVLTWNSSTSAWESSAPPAGGTVTSVALSGGTTGLTTSGGPITTSGTITLAGTLAVANGGTGATTAGAALTALGAAASGANSDITSLAGLTTALSVAQGGTGATSLAQYAVLLGNNTTAVSTAAPAAAGQVLTSNGPSANPSFQSVPYDIAGSAAGTPTASADCFFFVAVRACSIAASGHRAKCRVAPSNTVTFTLNKNGSSIGTVEFTVAGGTTGTVTITSGPVSMAAGDSLTLTAPANLYTILDPYFTLSAVVA